MAAAEPIVVRGGCPHDCPDTCAWHVTVENGQAVRLVGDPAHPFTRGGLCAKVNHFLDRVYSPERLLHPLRRVGPKGAGEFVQVGWDEALDDIAARLRAIVDADGPTAILPYSYAGTQGLVQGSSLDRRFFALLGATRLDRTICGSASGAGLLATVGANAGMLPEDLQHARFIILWGTNTIVTNLHLWPFIQKARADGATVVVIDPIKTRTAEAADWHVQPLPGTDAALALGMMHVLVAEGLYDRAYVEAHTVGFDQLRERLQEYPPERAARLTGLTTEEITRLARAYAATQPSAIRLLVGMEHHERGAMAFRTVSCLPALVGAWRHRGGGLLRTTSGYFRQALRPLDMPELQDRRVRSVNMAQLGRALLDPALDPPIRALLVYNSNPAATAPNQNLVLQGLRREDLFTVVLEQFMTDTACHADYVLPATTQVEHLDLLYSWGHTYLTLNQPAIAPRGEAIPNTELFRRLAARLGMDDPLLHESDEDLVRTALATGHPYLDGMTYERLLDEGWAPLHLDDAGASLDQRGQPPKTAAALPATSPASGAFGTPSGKIHLYSAWLARQGLDPLPAFVPARESPAGDPELAARYPLVLLTSKSALHFLNSSYANLPRHRQAEREPRLEMHPDDAAPRGIADGDYVRVHNDRGEVSLRVCLGDRVRPGVVSMPSGWWASLSPGGSSANALTPDGLSDLGGGADFHDTLVQVTAARATF
jgi:anaerobic selenocysteine-containing dehydrogenase